MRLFRWFILRRLVHERLRSATAVLGIALGIGVVVAIQLTNASSLRGFQAALDTVSGRASLEIVGTGVGLDETRLAEIAWLREFGDVAPLVEGELVIRQEGRAAETLRVLGVDALRDRAFRDYALVDAGVEPGDRLLDRLLDPHAAILTARFAASRGLSIGSTVTVLAGDRQVPLVVRGLLEDEGPARALDGRFVLMDIAAAQLALDEIGRLDRVEVRLADGIGVDAAEQAIAARLPAGMLVERPAQRGREVEQMLAAFHLNLTALSYVALVVGLFLVYNTISVAVLSRRDEIGILRALGVGRWTVRALFLAEAAALAAAGTAAGIAIGRLLADATVALTATTVSTLYVATAAAPPALDARILLLAVLTGVPLSLVAAAVPANEAARVPPIAAIRGEEVGGTSARMSIRGVAPGLALIGAGGWLATLGPVNGLPLFGYASALAIIFGASLLVPSLLHVAAGALERPIRRRLGVEAWLALTNVAASVRRLSISVAALAVSLSMMVAIAVMIGSFRETVVYWVEQTLRADLFVSPGSTGRPGVDATLSSDVVERIVSSPGVAAADRYRITDVPYDGVRVRVGGGDFGVLLAHGSLQFKAPPDARVAMRGAMGRDAVVASEPFTLKHGKQVGDEVLVPTRAGPRPFRIAAVYYDYSNDRGVLMMDRAVFERHFGDVGVSGVTVYLEAGVDPERARERLLAAAGDRRIFVNTNQALRAEVLRIFDSTFTITYALEIIAIVVAMLGVSGTLVTLILEREREVTILRLVGTDRRQIRRIVLGEAVLIGLVSQAIGIVVGLALSMVLIYVINVQSFGWTIQFHLPWAFLAQSSLLMVAATAVAGLYPASRAVRLTMRRDE
ncbi:MAG: ABC transporter permease [Acidobacteria bacterium]|nr:ABC transporter permease [Acidobacteriota bacterium]